MSSRKKIMITLIIILLLLTAGVYGYGVYYFTEHFLPGSMVNGFNCSYMTVSQSEELLTQKVGAYVLTIDTRNNGQESITAKQAGLSYDSDGSVDKLIRNQDRFTWFLAFNQHRNYEVSSSIKYDEQKTEAAISELKCMQQENMTEPSDAHIEEKDDKFVIVPYYYNIIKELNSDIMAKQFKLQKNLYKNGNCRFFDDHSSDRWQKVEAHKKERVAYRSNKNEE